MNGMSDGDYVCRLDEKSLATAVTELNESPRERLRAVDTLRTWILQQPHISSPTDAMYLLQFLRSAKFSQLMAREKLERFMAAKTAVPEWLTDIDTADSRLQAFISTGYILLLPGRNDKGHKVIMQRLGVLDPSSRDYDKSDILKANNAIIYCALMDENTQVNGLTFLVDCSHFTMRHKLFWGVDTMKKTIKLLQAFPARIRSLQFFNMDYIVEGLLSITKPLMPKKIQERVILHTDGLEALYDSTPPRMLPREYLPDDYTGACAGEIEEVISQVKDCLLQPSVRERIRLYTRREVGIRRAERQNGMAGGSYRKRSA